MFPEVVVIFYMIIRKVEVLQFLHIFVNTCMIACLIVVILTYFSEILMYISLRSNEVEHLIMRMFLSVCLLWFNLLFLIRLRMFLYGFNFIIDVNPL